MHSRPSFYTNGLWATCGQRHYTCGWTADKPESYTQIYTHNPHPPSHNRTVRAYNPNVTNISHTVFTQAISIFPSVTDCLYTLSTIPTKTTINSNNI